MKKIFSVLIAISLILFAATAMATTYLANTKSGKFHYYDCPTIKYPNAAHFVPYNSREAVVADGYIPCKRCCP